MERSRYGFNWNEGHYKTRELSRSFDSLEEAQRFADGKDDADVYRSKGRYKVKWIKKIMID